jgi:hypothetical protein
MNDFPGDWRYYTLNYPVAGYKHLSRDQIVREMNECNSTFYSASNIMSRLGRNLLSGHNPLFSLVSNFTSRKNSRLFAGVYEDLWQAGAGADEADLGNGHGVDLVDTWETIVQGLRQVVTTLKQPVAWFFRQS